MRNYEIFYEFEDCSDTAEFEAVIRDHYGVLQYYKDQCNYDQNFSLKFWLYESIDEIRIDIKYKVFALDHLNRFYLHGLIDYGFQRGGTSSANGVFTTFYITDIKTYPKLYSYLKLIS